MQQLEVHAVDRWDGGGRQNFAFYLSQKADADAWLKNHPHDLIRPVTLVIFDSLQEVDENEHKKVLQRIWDKLDPIERKAIGMKQP